jgi:hypothetical protein
LSESTQLNLLKVRSRFSTGSEGSNLLKVRSRFSTGSEGSNGKTPATTVGILAHNSRISDF